jgi:hypothetical protein
MSTKTVTVIPAEPGYRVAWFYDDPPSFKYSTIIAWVIETDGIVTHTWPVTPGSNPTSADLFYVVSPTNFYYSNQWPDCNTEEEAIELLSGESSAVCKSGQDIHMH